ncbi:type II secretion system protein GspL [Jannaschia sp.]|nr:type II secretion system protein GspL [Jannaschia sp.]
MTDQPDPFFGLSPDFVHAEVGTAALSRKQVLLVPGRAVAALPLELPAALRGQAREQVARRQLRDRLGPEAEACEMRPFATGTDGGAWGGVLVAHRDAVAAWRARAGDAGRAVLPDYLALPTADGLWTVARTPSGVAVRLGPSDGFGAGEEAALLLLEQALQRAEAPPGALLLLGDGLARVRLLAEARDIPVETKATAVATHGLPAPTILSHGELALDLRRDPQVARARLARRVLVWRWPLVLGLLAAALWSASQILQAQRLEEETARLRADNTALVRQHFVPVGPILDARVQVSRALEARRDASGGPPDQAAPLLLLNRVALVLTEQGARPETLGYEADGTLNAAIEVADFAAAEALEAALRANGLSVEVADTRAQNGAVRSELRLRAAP